jgi:hypothetical protein
VYQEDKLDKENKNKDDNRNKSKDDKRISAIVDILCMLYLKLCSLLFKVSNIPNRLVFCPNINYFDDSVKHRIFGKFKFIIIETYNLNQQPLT